MGLILDTSNFIAAERRGWNLWRSLMEIEAQTTDREFAVSAMTIAELRHGLERAQTDAQRTSRSRFLQDIMATVTIVPFNEHIALRLGAIDAQLTMAGNRIGVPDLIIGCTALELGMSVATSNLKDFGRIPALKIVSLR